MLSAFQVPLYPIETLGQVLQRVGIGEAEISFSWKVVFLIDLPT
jgi:hypothetical protein